jgi:hypothetical protein
MHYAIASKDRSLWLCWDTTGNIFSGWKPFNGLNQVYVTDNIHTAEHLAECWSTSMYYRTTVVVQLSDEEYGDLVMQKLTGKKIA